MEVETNSNDKVLQELQQLRSELITRFSLAEDADNATIIAALDTAIKGGEETSSKLADIQAQFDNLQKELEEKHRELDELYKAKSEAEIDEILAQYGDRIKDDKARAAIRTLLQSDRESGLAILNGLPAAPAPANTENDNPPPPTHDPAQQGDALSPEQKIAEAEKLIAAIRQEKGWNYEQARDEARRRKPELFS